MVRQTRKVTRIHTEARLRNVYGEMILPKGTMLYHTSEEPFTHKPTKPMLFCTFHPSEWEGLNTYVTRIVLKKDVSLFFMISGFRKTFVHSLLDVLINKPGNNLAKMNDTNLSCYVKHLKQEQFNGWISTIEGKSTVEVALINDSSVFEVSESEELHRNWRNANNANNIITHKNWGSVYPITTAQNPAILNLNERFKNDVESYKLYALTSTFPLEHTFQVVISNAVIRYFPGPNTYIGWNC